jgi:hypothetical protein
MMGSMHSSLNFIAVALAGFLGPCSDKVLEALPEPQSVTHARKIVSTFAFLDEKRIVLTNEFGELFISNDAGKHWEKPSAPRIYNLAIANGNELWSCAGGGVWYSSVQPAPGWTKIDSIPSDGEFKPTGQE